MKLVPQRQGNSQRSPLQILAAFIILAVFLFATGGSIFEAHVDSDCEDHCDDSCENCGDCINCLPTLHLLASLQSSQGAVHRQPSKLLLVSTDIIEGIFDASIDHPPQNIA